MKIENYSFGRISINGKIYNSDLILFPNRIETNWRRKKGHFLQLVDIAKIIDFNPKVLIFGTGKNGFIEVSDDLIVKLNDLVISYFFDKSSKAVERYNCSEELSKVLAIHLTC